MNQAIETLQAALQRGAAGRPRVGGFPYLAETLRQAGALRNEWTLPACQSLFLTAEGPVVIQGGPLLQGMAEVPPFDEAALIAALRRDQAGEGSFPEFLEASWKAGVVRYVVDFAARTVSYHGCLGETYIEAYAAVALG